MYTHIEKIKCHTCGRNAKIVSEYCDDLNGLTYIFKCGKGHISKLLESKRTYIKG